VDALNALPVIRPHIHPNYYFWSTKSNLRSLTITWVRKVDALNKYLHFTDEHGVPFKFRSHMLRDTFAVQLLLQGILLRKSATC